MSTLYLHLTYILLWLYNPSMNKLKDFLSVVQAAEQMGFKERTILKWCNTGILPYYKVGRQIRILEKDVVEWIKSGRA